MNTKINHVAVWVLVVVHQLVGFGWYAIFGEAWLNYHAKTMTDIERTHSFVPYLLAIIASIFVNYALAWLIDRLNARNAAAGLKIAIVCYSSLSLLAVSFSARGASARYSRGRCPLRATSAGQQPRR